MDDIVRVKTERAFDAVRHMVGQPRILAIQCKPDELRQMGPADGLLEWRDGPIEGLGALTGPPPLVTQAMLADRHLWVVSRDQVVYAKEACDFGRRLALSIIKHTNLTGGAAAFSAGELLFISEHTVIVNGRSGRYGPRTELEMNAVASAFRNSGYEVWSMGYDTDAGWPYPFIGVTPQWVL